MKSWLNALKQQTVHSIVVTMAKVVGSGPRESGAKMVVTAMQLFDTIGGGHLEMRAIAIAREMLSMSIGTLASERRLERFPLGPSLGQCCGGVVHLVFERINPDDADVVAYINCLYARFNHGDDSVRMVSLDTLDRAWITDTPSLHVVRDSQAQCHLQTDAEGHLWMVDPCLAYRHHLMLFGAGHVGAAIVSALAGLPCIVTWVDEREEQFPCELPSNVRLELTDAPELLIATAPPDMSFLVLTHSHALDQVLAEHILRRSHLTWFGLIGSKTKRHMFEHRLQERGITEHQLSKMVCPIGISGISGKSPAVIAIAVAAQLLQLWEILDKHD